MQLNLTLYVYDWRGGPLLRTADPSSFNMMFPHLCHVSTVTKPSDMLDLA